MDLHVKDFMIPLDELRERLPLSKVISRKRKRLPGGSPEMWIASSSSIMKMKDDVPVEELRDVLLPIPSAQGEIGNRGCQ